MEVGDDLEPDDSLLFTLKMFVFMLSKKFCGYAHTHARTHSTALCTALSHVFVVLRSCLLLNKDLY